MKKLLFALAVSFAGSSVCAQKADIILSYDEQYPTKTATSTKNKMSLLIAPDKSKYFNDISLFNDSLSSTPDGKKQLQEIIMATCITQNPDGSISVDYRKGPVKKVDLYVFTDRKDNKMTVYDKWALEHGYYTENLDEQEWSINSDSTQNILGYECIMAETDYHGRHWKAWFAPEIPYPFGPWKLQGLPGIILRAEADGGFMFTATGIEKTDRVITSIYSPQEYSKTTRLKALSDEDYYQHNAQSVLQAKYGGSVTVKSTRKNEDGTETPDPQFDGKLHSFEPDYLNK